MIDSLTPPLQAAPLDRHPEPAVQIRGRFPQAPFVAEEAVVAAEPGGADEPCDPRHFVPRWWPAPSAD